MIKMLKVISILLLSFTMVFNVSAKEKRVFSEDEFINVFSGKPKSRVLKYLGEPDKKNIAIKPKGAGSVVGSRIKVDQSQRDKAKVEMWYYNHLVEYAPEKTYKFVELTLMNDRIVNIGFFNQ
ncbi:hypothetical protein OAQ60_02690 [Methylophilaceae bacterium]|nr:hypothetical protein [Methylophilaceae bacterium]|tara:strand:+ start:245 stop:613 length:369 start_codon:yes stop_codon:yes gene_type:complete